MPLDISDRELYLPRERSSPSFLADQNCDRDYLHRHPAALLDGEMILHIRVGDVNRKVQFYFYSYPVKGPAGTGFADE
jgi:hypothetical protein